MGLARLLTLSASLIVFSVLAVHAESRVALVIGNSDYKAVGNLPNPEQDASLVAQTLKADNFDVSLVVNATRSQMTQALQAFNERADQADWALVYYAGHGIELGGINYLLPTDAHLRFDRDVQDEGVSLNRVTETVSGAKKLRIVILDACRNNPFVSTMKRSIATRAVDRGLARIEPEAGIIVVYSAAEGQVASDGTGDHSPFTSAFVAHLQDPGLEINRFFNVVTADVLEATNQRQRPFQYGSNPSREEFFFKSPINPVVTNNALDTHLMTQDSHREVVLAKVNGRLLTEDDINIASADLASEVPSSLEGTARKAYLIDYMIDMTIFAQKFSDQYDSGHSITSYHNNKKLMERALYDVGKMADTPEAEKKVYDDAAKAHPPETEIHARHILMPTKTEATAALARIKKGEDFAKVADDISKDPGSPGGDLGWFNKDKMVPEFSNAAFSLEIGQISNPVKTEFGWHIIKIEDKRENTFPPFETVKNQVARWIIQKAQSDTVQNLRAAGHIERMIENSGSAKN